MIRDMCNTLPITVHKCGYAGTAIHDDAGDTADLFKKLFTKYSVCHLLINRANHVTDKELQQLGKYSYLLTYDYEEYPVQTLECNGHEFNWPR